jgi:hypothetical protein
MLHSIRSGNPCLIMRAICTPPSLDLQGPAAARIALPRHALLVSRVLCMSCAAVQWQRSSTARLLTLRSRLGFCICSSRSQKPTLGRQLQAVQHISPCVASLAATTQVQLSSTFICLTSCFRVRQRSLLHAVYHQYVHLALDAEIINSCCCFLDLQHNVIGKLP